MRFPLSTRLLPPIALLAVLCLPLASPSYSVADEGGMRVKAGEAAPDFVLEDLGTGRQVRLSDRVGKGVILLEFWAPWCDICKLHLGRLVGLQEAWRAKGVSVLSVAMNYASREEVRKISCGKNLDYPVLLDHDLQVASKAYGLAGFLPLMVLIDRKGVVRYSHYGEFDAGEGPRQRLEELTREKGDAEPPPPYQADYCAEPPSPPGAFP